MYPPFKTFAYVRVGVGGLVNLTFDHKSEIRLNFVS